MKRGANSRSLIKYLPAYGCISTSLLYGGIGVTAILSFLQIRRGGADESALLAVMHEHAAGRIMFWIILTGTVCYIAWRLLESIRDPYGYGRSLRGISRRSAIALSTIPDILIAFTAVQILLGVAEIRTDGRPVALRDMIASVLEWNYGGWIVAGVGLITGASAGVQFFYGITKGYRERIDIDYFNADKKWLIHFFAWVGYLARGVILGVMGFFLIKAGLSEDAELVVNTDKAFDFIGDNAGYLCFVLTAVGTVCYGVFMFIQGIVYDPDKD